MLQHECVLLAQTIGAHVSVAVRVCAGGTFFRSWMFTFSKEIDTFYMSPRVAILSSVRCSLTTSISRFCHVCGIWYQVM